MVLLVISVIKPTIIHTRIVLLILCMKFIRTTLLWSLIAKHRRNYSITSVRECFKRCRYAGTKFFLNYVFIYTHIFYAYIFYKFIAIYQVCDRIFSKISNACTNKNVGDLVSNGTLGRIIVTYNSTTAFACRPMCRGQLIDFHLAARDLTDCATRRTKITPFSAVCLFFEPHNFAL
jgi:hypothetical protein